MLLLFFSILACNTSNTKWLFYSLSQHLTRLANDFPALFCLTGRVYQYAHTNFFSFGLYHLNQLKKEKKSIYACILINKISKKKKYNFFLFWPVTLQTLNGSSTVLVSTQQGYPMTFLLFFLQDCTL